jgi:hypothetical protein
MEYLIPGGLLVFFISSLICVNMELTKRPTFKESDDRYKKTEVCEEIHKAVKEKLDCIPIIKDTVVRLETKMDILLKNGR